MSEYHLSTPIGVHRLLKKPYDDSEIFYNTSDFINYLKNGAGYNGQIVKVLIGEYDDNIEEADRPLVYATHPYMQQFMIHNYSAIPIIKNNILNNLNNSILIYNHNSKLFQDGYINNNYMYTHYVFDNAFYFSLLNGGMLDILNFNKSINENSKYFSFKYIKHPTGITDPIIEQSWSQLYNPFSDESTITTAEQFDYYCEKYYEIFHYIINNILVLHKNDSNNNNSILELVRYSKENNDTIVEEVIYNDILMIKNTGDTLDYSYRNIRIEMQVSESIKYINDLNLF